MRTTTALRSMGSWICGASTVGLLLAGCASSPPPAPAPVTAAPTPPPVPATPTVSKGGAPLAAKKPVTDRYFDVEVTDDYRWLEDVGSADTKAFVEAQNALTRKTLDALPGRAGVNARLKEVMGARLTSYAVVSYVKGQVFALKIQPPRQQPLLVVMPSADATDKEKPVIDTMAIDPSGHTSMDWYRVSPDGKYVVASLSSGGSEAGDAHVFEVATGKEVFEVVPRINGGTAGGDVAWTPDSKGFYYSRYPRGEERPAEDRMFYTQVYYHALGTPTDKDRYEVGKEFPRIAEIRLFTNPAKNPDGELLATVANGDGGEFMHLVRNKAGQWKQLTRYEDRVIDITFGEKGELLLLSRKDAARGKVLRAPLKGFDLAKATVLIPEGKDAIPNDFAGDPSVLAHGGRLFVRYQTGGPSEVRVFDAPSGKALPGPSLAPVSQVEQVEPADGAAVLLSNVSFVSPRVWMRFDPVKKETRKTAISTKTPVDLSGIKVVREMAPSKDGTKVPVNILLPRGATPGTPIPFDVYGYGGYGVNMTPNFQALGSVLLEHGVGLAIVNLRGGGEFGDAWHTAGQLTKKQNVFDDLAGAIEFLVKSNYAAKDRVAIHGGSNGGLLMGALLTQRPDLVRVVVSWVGIYDMLRVETEPNGAFNVTEFGTVKNEEQFRALDAYSPYHHVKDGAAYPPVLLLTGANDVRVAPWHSHKMAARLQAATSSEAPILERVAMSSGHGMGTALDARIEEYTDAYTFMLHELGIDAPRASQ